MAWPAEHGVDAPPRQLAVGATAHVALCTCVVAASTQEVTRASRTASSTVACHGVHARRQTKPPRLLRLCIDGRPAEHELAAPPRQLAAAATAHAALCTHAVAPSPRSLERRRVSDGRMSWRARTPVNEATTLAKAVHRWQARRARPRCASTPTGSSRNSPRRHLHVCRRSIHSGGHTCIEPPSIRWHVMACTHVDERSHHAC